jgi:hypothetical protein
MKLKKKTKKEKKIKRVDEFSQKGWNEKEEKSMDEINKKIFHYLYEQRRTIKKVQSF